MATQEMNRIYVVGGEKGGVGKTFISRSLCQYFSSRGEKFSLVEADSQIDDVGRIYQEQAVSTHTITLSDHPERSMEPDVILQAAMKAPTVVNLPSNTLAVLEEWISRTELLEMIEKQCRGQQRLVKWFVSDGCRESIRQLEASIFSLGGSIPHIVILNHGRLNGLDFSYLDTNPAYQRIKEQPNFIIDIEFPALESAIQFAIDDKELTLEDAREPISEELGILAGQRIINFVRKFTEAFDRAIEELERVWNLPDAQKAEPMLDSASPEVTQAEEASDSEPTSDGKPTGGEISAGLRKKGKQAGKTSDSEPLKEAPGEGFDTQSESG